MTNREILFRGKYCGKWVYGWYFEEDGDSWIKENDMISSVVAQSTVGQYTGMYDKNNNRIFEGDIVTLFDEMCVVKASEVRASFGLYKISNGMFYEMIHKNDQKWLEVVGNIFDNLELLDEVQK
jgi:hypothetical protein